MHDTLSIQPNRERRPTILQARRSDNEFTAKGFLTKITKFASQLSGKPSIYDTELMEKVNEVNKLRTSIQHWDVERREDYFVNLPDNHPLKVFVNVSPSRLADNIRQVLDHYSLKDASKPNKTT